MKWLLGIAFLGVACQFSRAPATLVPFHVHPIHSASDFHVPRTPLYVSIPRGFTYVDSADAIRGEGATVAIDYMDGFSFQELLGPIFHKMDSTAEHQDFRMGPYQAHILSVDAPLIGRQGWIMAFGDSAFVVKVDGKMPGVGDSVKKKVMDIMLSMYIDRARAMRIPADAPFGLDLGRNGYGFYTIFGNRYHFTIGGGHDRRDSPYFLVFLPDPGNPLDHLKGSMDSVGLHYVNTRFSSLPDGRWEVLGEVSNPFPPRKVYGLTAGPLVFLGFYYADSSLVELKRIASSLKIKP